MKNANSTEIAQDPRSHTPLQVAPGNLQDNPQNPRLVWDNIRIYVDKEDSKIPEVWYGKIRDAISDAGASMTDEAAQATHVVVRHAQREIVAEVEKINIGIETSENLRNRPRIHLCSYVWLIACLQAEEALDPEAHALYRPLPDETIPGIEDVPQVSITGFVGLERLLAQLALISMGCSFSLQYDPKRTGLLVAADVNENSRKAEAARRQQVPIVNLLWALDCLESWTVKQTSKYECCASINIIFRKLTQEARTSTLSAISDSDRENSKNEGQADHPNKTEDFQEQVVETRATHPVNSSETKDGEQENEIKISEESNEAEETPSHSRIPSPVQQISGDQGRQSGEEEGNEALSSDIQEPDSLHSNVNVDEFKVVYEENYQSRDPICFENVENQENQLNDGEADTDSIQPRTRNRKQNGPSRAPFSQPQNIEDEMKLLNGIDLQKIESNKKGKLKKSGSIENLRNKRPRQNEVMEDKSEAVTLLKSNSITHDYEKHALSPQKGDNVLTDHTSEDEPSKTKIPLITLSGMHSPEQKTITNKLAEIGVRCISGVHSWRSDFTHVVAPSVRRNQKCLAALASGSWIVGPSFVEDSYKAKELVEESPHELIEASTNSFGTIAPGVSRHWRLRKQMTSAGAFSGIKVAISRYIRGTPSRKDIIAIVIAGDGEIVSLESKPDLYVASSVSPAILSSIGKIESDGPCIVDPLYIVEWLVTPHKSLESHILCDTRPSSYLETKEIERAQSED